MKKLKRAYYYLFYTFYKWYEAGPFVWASDWKASLSILVLQIWILVSLVVYYKILFDRYLNIEFNREDAYLIVFPFVIIDYIVFNYKNRWKKYVRDFDSLPKSINRKWQIITWIIILLLFGNVIFSFYLMSLIDWSQYR